MARRRSWPRAQLVIRRVAAALVIAFVVSLILGRFLPVPSTLMLGRWVSFLPVDRQWVSLEATSPHILRAVLASEDQRYCLHRGVDFEALREVIDDEDGPARGASTITMQVAKNIYLWPGRSYIRKALEIPLALLLDLVWGKQRVMEIYLNIAEWGDGIFGIEAASRRVFGKSAKDLQPNEAARLASILPSPVMRRADRASAASRRILSRMSDVDALMNCLGR